MIFPGFPGILSFFQVFQVEWKPWITSTENSLNLSNIESTIPEKIFVIVNETNILKAFKNSEQGLKLNEIMGYYA